MFIFDMVALLAKKKTVTTLNILMKIDDSDKQFVSLGAKTASNH